MLARSCHGRIESVDRLRCERPARTGTGVPAGDTPPGSRCADYTASGRSLDFIEDAIRDHVLPRYANTHTESSGTGLATGRLREDARRVIHDALGGTDEHVVIFCGSGATAAINKLVGILELRLPDGPARRYGLLDRIPAGERPVVFVGP